MKYAPPTERAGDDELARAESLIARALAGGDRASVEREIESAASHASPVVRRAAAIALGHVARVHSAIDRALAARVLLALSADPLTRAAANDARDDVAAFARA